MVYLGVSEEDVLSGESRKRAAATLAAPLPLGVPAGGLRGRRPASCAAPFRAIQSAEVAMVSMIANRSRMRMFAREMCADGRDVPSETAVQLRPVLCTCIGPRWRRDVRDSRAARGIEARRRLRAGFAGSTVAGQRWHRCANVHQQACVAIPPRPRYNRGVYDKSQAKGGGKLG